MFSCFDKGFHSFFLILIKYSKEDLDRECQEVTVVKQIELNFQLNSKPVLVGKPMQLA